MSNYCSECGNELTEGEKFCSECGTEIDGDAGNETEWETPEETGEWPYGERKKWMKEGRKKFGYCPACGLDGMWLKEGLTRGTGNAECKLCDAKWVSRSHGFGSFGQYEYECVTGPANLVGEVKVEDGWKHTGPNPGDVDESPTTPDEEESEESVDEGSTSNFTEWAYGFKPGQSGRNAILGLVYLLTWPISIFVLIYAYSTRENVSYDDTDELVESKRENFDKTLGRLPGLSNGNTTRRNVLVGGGYAFLGLTTVGVLAGGGNGETPLDEWEFASREAEAWEEYESAYEIATTPTEELDDLTMDEARSAFNIADEIYSELQSEAHDVASDEYDGEDAILLRDAADYFLNRGQAATAGGNYFTVLLEGEAFGSDDPDSFYISMEEQHENAEEILDELDELRDAIDR